MDLSQVQEEAVRYVDGPSMVIAGAGSGKTRVLTHKIAYLLQQGYKPWNILALTFTNKAAREMKERIAQIVGKDKAQYLVMGTFHSVFARILRTEAEAIGFNRNYTIYDDADSKQVIKQATEEVLKMIVPPEKLKDELKIYKPQNIASSISLAKNRLVTPELYAASTSLKEYDERNQMPAIYLIYKEYTRILKENNAMDFDDLLVNTYQLFTANEAVRQRYAAQFQFVLVDEYQDTNNVQQQIIHLIVREHRKVCVVGDDAQSIYAFRGANLDNMLHFNTLFPELKTFKLEENYRSTQSIVNLANDLISHNTKQLEKNVFSNQQPGSKPTLMVTKIDKQEADLVCKHIIRLHAVEHIPYGQFAVLYRTNAQSRLFEEALRRYNLPYRIYGGISFYQRAEIKNVLAYFRLIVNPDDNEAFLRIINYPKRGIGQTTVSRIQEIADAKGRSLWQTTSSLCAALQGDTSWAGFFTAEELKLLRGKTKEEFLNFVSLIEGCIAERDFTDAYALGKSIVTKAKIDADLYADTTIEGKARQENLQELFNSLAQFVRTQREEGNGDSVALEHFLTQITLQASIDEERKSQPSDGGEEKRDEDQVCLLTMHTAKGLEFETVFVVGLEEGLFPSSRCTFSLRALEEERRLFYVAVTRAKTHLFLSHSEHRYLYGSEESVAPSRFLHDIDDSLINKSGGAERGFFQSSSKPSYQETSRPSYRETSRPSYRDYQSAPKPSRPAPAAKPANTFSYPPGSSFRRISKTGSGGASSSASGKWSNLKPQTVIEHSRFGRGTVLKIEGTGENTKATIDFQSCGPKQILLKFATFTVVG